MNKYYIYGLFNNGVVFYVGVTINCLGRELSHRIKYGNDFIFIVLEEYVGSKYTALSIEETWIKKYHDLGYSLFNKNKKAEKKVTFTFAALPSTIEAAKYICSEDGITLSELIHDFVVKYANDNNPEPFNIKEYVDEYIINRSHC